MFGEFGLKLLLLLYNGPFQLLNLPVFFEKFIEQHGIHSVAAHGVWWAYNVFTYSINCFFCSGVRFVPKL